nr:hypothetical protein [Tanacetum cinerariifolium]
MYNIDLKSIVPSGDLTCLFAKATLYEYNLWHRRLGHINFKTMNKLVKGNLVRGLPSKVFENDHTCVACKKGKQHRASCKTKPVNSVNQPLQRTLIEAVRTMLVDSLLPIPFLAEAVNTACYVQNRVLVTKPTNKTPYELLLSRTPSIGLMRPFDYHVTILNTLDPLGEENVQQYVLFSVWSSGSNNPQNTDGDVAFEVKEPEFKGRKPQSEVYVSLSSSAQTKKHDNKTKREAKGKSPVESSTGYRNLSTEFEDFSDNRINEVNVVDSLVPAVGQISTNSTNTFSAGGPSNTVVSPTHGKSLYVNTSQYPDDLNIPELEDITYSDDEEDVGAEANFTNLETTITVSPIPTTKVHKDHSMTQIIGDLSSATQTRIMTRVAKDQGYNKLLKIQVGLKLCRRSYFNLRCRRNKARLVTQGHTQEEGIDYEEVFALVARIEAIRLFLAYASFMGFMVYQMDVKSAFLYGTIEEEVYICQTPRFKDPDYPDKVYKVVKALYGLHQAPRAWQIWKRIRELELQREMRKETESRYVVRDDVNEEEEYPSFDSYPQSFEPIYLDIFSEDEPRFDEEEVVNSDNEESSVFNDDQYEAETENIFGGFVG